MAIERDNHSSNSMLSGLLILFYASLGLLVSFVLWAYSENVHLWAWLYRLMHLLTYTPYSNLLKAASLSIGLVALAGVAWGLVILWEQILRQRTE